MKTTRTSLGLSMAAGALALGISAAAIADDTPQTPLDKHASQLTQERIAREEAAQAARTRAVDEALSAVQETRTALTALENKNAEQARTALTRALGKLDIALTSHPDLALMPLSADIRLVDTHADAPMIKRISRETKDLVRHDRLQEARFLIRQLASELDITTVNVPVATYPPAIRAAAGQIDQGELAAAHNQLLSALQSLVVVERVIPLPIIRAQALVDEVSRQAGTAKLDKAEANRLLTQADDQLKLAQDLGYGTRRDEFSALRSQVAQVRKSVNRNEESRGLLARIKSGLEALREKLSRAPASK